MSKEPHVSEGQEAFLLHAVQRAFHLDHPKRIGVAVSGGGDSMALLHLVHRVVSQTGWQINAVTVDHGLRPEAADEAALVAKFCAGLGISHDTVKWADWDGKGNLQDQARRARYRLIADWAKRIGVTHIALGHTADDQAETFLMRLARSAGVDGLAAMRGRWAENDLIWVRPLLSAKRRDLRDYLSCKHVAWIDDPSNDDPRFDRVKARKALKALKPLGITQDTLSNVAQNLTSARDALTSTAANFAREHCNPQFGDLLITRDELIRLPYDLYRRVMMGALRWMSGEEYAPRANTLRVLHHMIATNGKPRTLVGCRISVASETVRIARENNAVRDLSCPTTDVWDNRWQFTGPHAPDLTIHALGAEGLKLCSNWRETGLPRASLLASPAIWREDELVAAPLAGLKNGWQADLAPNRNNFAQFLLTH